MKFSWNFSLNIILKKKNLWNHSFNIDLIEIWMIKILKFSLNNILKETYKNEISTKNLYNLKKYILKILESFLNNFK